VTLKYGAPGAPRDLMKSWGKPRSSPWRTHPTQNLFTRTPHTKRYTRTLFAEAFLQTQILSTTLQLRTLAPSPRILAYLARKGRLNGAVMTIEQPTVHVGHPEKFPPTPETFEPPPEVVTTPCDPIPRPYYIERGLRRVAPYHYTYNTYCKERWRGKEILEIFATEFRDRKPEYYVD
jgi:hypothetical protein